MSTNSDELNDLLNSTAVAESDDGGTVMQETNPDAIVPDAPRTEEERIEPKPTGPVTLQSGLVVDILPLRLRASMKLLRIVTHGAGRAGIIESAMGSLNLDDGEEFAQNLAALFLFALPEAEDESVEFFQSMVLPADYTNLSQEVRMEQLNALALEMADPDLNDVATIIERVIRRESEELRSLGKRITSMLNLAKRLEKKPAAS